MYVLYSVLSVVSERVTVDSTTYCLLFRLEKEGCVQSCIAPEVSIERTNESVCDKNANKVKHKSMVCIKCLLNLWLFVIY